MTDTNAPLNTLEGVAALEKAAREGLISVLDEKSPTGETLIVTPSNYMLHKLPALNALLLDHVSAQITLVEPESFHEYVSRFKTANSIAVASLSHQTIIARLDYHTSTADGADGAPRPQHGTHAATYQAAYDPDWKKWAAMLNEDAPYMPQAKFAEFLLDMVHTVALPAMADLQDAILHIEIDRSVKLKSRKNLTNGTVQVTYEETDAAGNTTGTGTVELPSQIGLVVPVFQGADAVNILVRLKYDLQRGGMSFKVALPGLDKLVSDEFRKIGDAVEAATGLPLFYTA